ncbi:DUF3352 domain-containing protein [Pedobacter sp. L105]|uniref:DUF3352 domain-containing protein n=1 Tax=Pedobacter sp. L105 TaxID=1641871 RepID=UPI00131C49BA|nr:DUF3352 domain-containing protein [Pedobacter sp. L105]
MKRIYFTLIILLLAMAGMAYLYFSKLNREHSYNEISLYAATENSGLVFSVQNDKSVLDILKGQNFFQKLIGATKFNQLSLLKDKIIANPAINNLISKRDIYISFSAGKNKKIDYLLSTQLNDERDKPMLLEMMRSNGMQITDTAGIMKLIVNDSTSLYLGMEKNLILLSNQPAPVKTAINPQKKTTEFVAYIQSNNKLSKNSVGNLYIDFNKIPALLKATLPGTLSGNLSVFNHQDSFSALNYNFSRERVFFNGNTHLNDKNNYLYLFTNLTPQKNTIDNLLPDQTANFRLFVIPNYKTWRNSLKEWFKANKDAAKVKNIIEKTNRDYHLDPEDILPVYFKDQLITFQLKSAEDIAAINLTNGDRVKQLLLDISEDDNQDIKLMKVSGLFYCYFGEPFKKFSKPYYTIIDNYLVFSNRSGALEEFLNAYKNNKLLVNTPDYINLYSQISNNSSITFYVNPKNSSGLIRKNIYMPFYKHFTILQGVDGFSSFIYQLNGDKGNFQTNLLLNTVPESTATINPNLQPEN